MGHGVIYFGKTDLVSAFRILPIKPEQQNLLMMKTKHPEIWEILYFIDKCLPSDQASVVHTFNSFQMP